MVLWYVIRYHYPIVSCDRHVKANQHVHLGFLVSFDHNINNMIVVVHSLNLLLLSVISDQSRKHNEDSTFDSLLTGMHRKSIEAAEKLGHSDDEMEGCDSKDGMSECSSRSGHEMNKQQQHHQQQRVPPANNNNMSKQQNASSPADTLSPKSSGKGTPGPHRPTPPTLSPLNDRPSPEKCNTSSNNNNNTSVTTIGGVVIRDDLRTSSIAALRARAMEHNAKMLHSLPGPPGSIMPPNHPSGGMGDPNSSAALLYHLDRQNASTIPTSMPYPFHSAPVRPIYWTLSSYYRHINVQGQVCITAVGRLPNKRRSGFLIMYNCSKYKLIDNMFACKYI